MRSTQASALSTHKDHLCCAATADYEQINNHLHH